MRFFERQDDSRRATRFLAIVTLLGAVAVAGSGGLLIAGLGIAHEVVDVSLWLEAAILLGVVVLVIMLLVIGVRRIQLGWNAGSVPKAMGAIEVAERPYDPKLRELRNVVAEMAIAAQMAHPQLFVLDDAMGIDAFASGLDSEDASITVTRGALEKLSREELQAVIAHEFSHIANEDIRINLRLMSLTAGLRVFWAVGAGIVRAAVRIAPGKNKIPAAMFATIMTLPLLWMGSFGVLFSRIMKAGISRQREHLADSSAVQYTRNPEALIKALQKAAAARGKGGRGAVHAELVSHMLFVGRKTGWLDLLATHPSIERRIELLKRNLTGVEPGHS